VYSPKIAEELIPSLYALAKQRKMPMTRLVNNIIRSAITNNDMPDGNAGAPRLYIREAQSAEEAA